MEASGVVSILIFAGTMAFVGWPLVHPLLAEDEPTERERRRTELLEEKERLLASLRDLDHDHRTGKLDDADHVSLTAKLKVRAAEVLKELDVHDGRKVLRPGDAAAPASPAVGGPGLQIGADSPTIRVTHADLKAEMTKAAAGNDASRFCTKCGRPAKAVDDTFCGKCGAALPTDG